MKKVKISNIKVKNNHYNISFIIKIAIQVTISRVIFQIVRFLYKKTQAIF